MLVESLPQHKALSELGLSFAWISLPDPAKRDLTNEHLTYAATQRTLDPDPNQRLAIHVQLLAYLYPLRDGSPAVDQGLRHDLKRRMADPHVFHPLSVNIAHTAPALPPAEHWLPVWTDESAQQRRERLDRLAQQTGVSVP
jgi:hypothetical protein